jgi:hypothetical protein
MKTIRVHKVPVFDIRNEYKGMVYVSGCRPENAVKDLAKKYGIPEDKIRSSVKEC